MRYQSIRHCWPHQHARSRNRRWRETNFASFSLPLGTSLALRGRPLGIL